MSVLNYQIRRSKGDVPVSGVRASWIWESGPSNESPTARQNINNVLETCDLVL